MSRASLPDPSSWRGRRVLVTGHTGFKGSWLCLWLARLGASVSGLALDPPTQPSNFVVSRVHDLLDSDLRLDVRDYESLARGLDQANPEVIFHLAAQPIVLSAFSQPRETWEVNLMGTVNLLEAVRRKGGPCAVVVVTSDKCYERSGEMHRHVETDPLGGTELYGSTKAASEIAVASYRDSFFDPSGLQSHRVVLASARASNVIGGGDWAEGRIVPDVVRALALDEPVPVRNPHHVRPFQHVLEPLAGYLILGERLNRLVSGVGTQVERSAVAEGKESWSYGADHERSSVEEAAHFCSAFNFGPRAEDEASVRTAVESAIQAWGKGSWQHVRDPDSLPENAGSLIREAPQLRLASKRAKDVLGWQPTWAFPVAVGRAIEWYRRYLVDPRADMSMACHEDIDAYESDARVIGSPRTDPPAK